MNNQIIKVEEEVNNLLSEKLFAGIRKIIVQKHKNRFLKSNDYLQANSHERKELLKINNKKWYESITTFFLSYKAIFALHPLVLREMKIMKFVSEEITRVKVDYTYNGVEFTVFFPTSYTSDMTKEIEDCILELQDPKYKHVVNSYISKTDTEKNPPEPLTTAKIKYSAFYLLSFEPKYTTLLLDKLHQVNLITDPKTDGWLIDDDFAEEMISVLNGKFKESQVLQYKRVYSNKDESKFDTECIRPCKISNSYFPKNIKLTTEFKSIEFEHNKELEDAIKLYEFIFYITLSSQMRNSIYDTSKIEIAVGNKMLKEQANVAIDGEENWEKLVGKFVKKIDHNSDTYHQRTVVIPEIPLEEVLNYQNVYISPYNTQRPPRFGIGRFITQILENYSIGKNNEHENILKELVNSQAIRTVQKMIIPQESSIVLIEWMIENTPTLLELDYLKELNEKIRQVANNEITLQSLLEELSGIIELGFEKCGIILDDTKPTQAKINLAKAIASKNNLTLDDSIFTSNVKIDMLIAKYPVAEAIKVGSCPKCNSLVFQKEFIKQGTGEVLYYFACEKFDRNGGCNFSIWDSYIYNFFSYRQKEFFTVEERVDALKKIMARKRGYLFSGLIGKNKQPYDAKVFLAEGVDKKTKQLKWVFQMKFENKKR